MLYALSIFWYSYQSLLYMQSQKYIFISVCAFLGENFAARQSYARMRVTFYRNINDTRIYSYSLQGLYRVIYSIDNRKQMRMLCVSSRVRTFSVRLLNSIAKYTRRLVAGTRKNSLCCAHHQLRVNLHYFFHQFRWMTSTPIHKKIHYAETLIVLLYYTTVSSTLTVNVLL